MRCNMKFKKWYETMKEAAYKDACYVETQLGLIHYTDIGPKNAPVILHVHGSPAGAEIGPIFFGDFVKKGYRVITPSRPGFLGTPLSAGESIKDQGRFLNVFCKSLGLSDVTVHAWSGGGPPAIQFAMDYPNIINGLILYCAVGDTWVHRISTFERMLLSDRGIWILHTLSKWMPEQFRKKSAEELGVNYDYVVKDEKRVELLDKFFEMTAPPSLRNPGSFNDIKNYSEMKSFDFSKMHVPSLVLFSPSDNQLDLIHGDKPGYGIQNVEYLKFKKGGHMPSIDEDAGLVLETMVAFIRKHK